MDRVLKLLALVEWRALLSQQETERRMLKAIHEEQRECFYRENKKTLDNLTNEERS